MKNVDRITGISFILFGLIFLYETTKLPVDSQSYPRFMIGIMMVLALLVIIRSFMRSSVKKTWGELFEGVEWKRLLFVLLGSLGYLFLVNVLGFFVTTIIYLLITMIVLKANRLTILISIPVFTLVLYLIFRVFLKVPLPTGYFI